MHRFLLPLVCCFVFFGGMTISGDEPADREQKVVDRFWTLLEKSPRRGTALDRVYGFHADTGRIDELLDRCRKQTDSNTVDAWLLLGLVLSRSGSDEEATTALEKAVALEPKHLLAATYLAELRIARNKLREAAETLEAALPSKIDTASAKDVMAALQMLGRIYERYGDRENSMRIWDRLETLFPADAEVRLQIAETLEEEGKWDAALERYRELAEAAKEPFDRVRFTLAAAEIKIRKGEKAAAVADFERLLDGISDENWLAGSIRDRLERVFVRSADYPGLDEYYRNRLESRPGELDTVRRRAVVLVRLSRAGEAKKLLLETLARAPSNVPLRLALIDLLVAEKDFQAAAEQYAKIDELEPNNPDHLTQWGLVTLENQDFDEADRKADAAKIWGRIAKPDDAASIIAVAELLNSAGIEDEAEKRYKQAVEIRPGDPSYVEYLGYFYHHRRRKDDAVAVLRKIAEGNRRTAANLSQLAGIFRSLGYGDEALAAYREAAQLEPKDFELRMQIAGLLMDREEYEAAETEYRFLEKLVGPEITEPAARLLREHVKLLQVTDRLDTEIEASVGNLWRLAVLQAAANRPKDAVKTIDGALKITPDSMVLLDIAAGIFIAADDRARAVKVYRRLVEADAPRRIDHLRRLANLYREMRDMNMALETAKQAMAVGAGNPAHARFYAEMLFSAKRHREGIEVLRRAVRLDPGDEITAGMLAEALFSTDRFDEAIEITWRMFEKAGDLQDKLALVSRLSAYYSKTRKSADLFMRLRSLGRDAGSRREAAYCTAQAHISAQEYDKARKELESLLLGVDGTDGKQSDDVLLLSQLSKIAELQNDLPAAIRYQEILCEKSESAEESARLLTLYRLGGERDKTVDRLLRNISERGKLHEQLGSIDDFLSRDEYASARRLLDRLAMKHPNHWEILYRQMMLDAWQGNEKAAKTTAETILALDLDRTEPTEKKRNEKPKIATPPGSPAARFAGITFFSVSFSGQQYGWQFGQLQQNMSLFDNAPLPYIQQRWNHLNMILLQTVFREKLEYFEPPRSQGFRPGQTLPPSRQTAVPKQPPPKPQFEPENFGDVRFAALVWRLRFSLQTDVKDVLAEFRKAAPVDDSDTARLTERLRFENVLYLLFENSRRHGRKFGETNFALLLLEDGNLGDTATCREYAARLRHQIAYELALRGETDWFPAAYREVLKDLYTEFMMERLPDIEPGGDLERRLTEAIKDPVIQQIFSATDIDYAPKALLNKLRTVREQSKTLSLRNGHRLELLRRCWDEIGRQSFENRPGGESDLFLLLSEDPIYVKVLRQRGLTAELDRSREVLQDLSHRIPWVRAIRANAVLANLFENDVERQPDSMSNLIDFTRLYFDVAQRSGISATLHGVWNAESVNSRTGEISGIYDLIKANERNIRPDQDGERLETYRAFLETMKDDIIADRQLSQQAGAGWMNVGQVPTPQAQYDAFFAKYLEARLRPIQLSLSRYISGVTPQRHYAFVGGMFASFEVERQGGTVVARTVDRAMLDKIAAAEKEIHRVTDAYFECLEMLETAPMENRKLLARFQRVFEQTDENNDRFKQAVTPWNRVHLSPETTLVQAAGFLGAVDDFLTTAKPEGDLTASERGNNFLRKFEILLEVRSKLGTDCENRHVEAFHLIRQQFTRRQEARYTGGQSQNRATIPLPEIIAQLEADVREHPDPRKLVMLAVQEKRRSRFEKAMEYLDAVPLDDPDEIRLRDRWTLQMFNLGAGPESLKPKVEAVLKRFAGQELSVQELVDLKRTQELLGRDEDAQKNRELLIAKADDLPTQFELLKRFKENGEGRNPSVVEFAVRVFWDPDVQRALEGQNTVGRQTREIVLDMLSEAGKIDEMIEEAENRMKDTGAGVEPLISLAELYFRAGNAAKLEATMKRVDEGIGGPVRDSPAYMNYLSRTGMQGAVQRWRHQMAAKSAAESLEKLADTPQTLLRNLSKEATAAETYGLVPRYMEILGKNESEPLARSFGDLLFHLERWLDRKAHKDDALKLLRHLWALEKTDEKSRREIRIDIISAISHRTKYLEYYPLFHDVMFDYFRTGESVRHETAAGPMPFDPLRISVWGLDRGFCLAVTFLDLAEKAGKLDELAGELRKAVNERLPSPRGETAALALLAMTEARRGRAGEAVAAVHRLDELVPSGTVRPGNLLIAQELVRLDGLESLVLAQGALERELKVRKPDARLDRLVKSLLDTILAKETKN